MKKFLLYIIAILSFTYLFSCAPLKKKTCETRFLSIVKETNQKKDIKKVKGSIYIKGILLLFNASLKDKTQIDLFTPIGTRIAKFYEDKNHVCLILKNKKICGKAPKMYKEAFSEEIPFSLTDIILGKFNISPKSKYICEDSSLKITDGEKVFVYENNLLKEIKYKDFSLEYEYEDNKPEKILLKVNSHTLAKIFIRDIE